MNSYRIESRKMQIIAVLLCFVLLLTMLGLPTWVFSVQSDIQVEVQPEQAVYYAGEEVNFEVQYTNRNDDALQYWNLVAEVDSRDGKIEQINGNILNPETGEKSEKNHKYLGELASGEKSDKVIFTLKLSNEAASSGKVNIKFSALTGEIIDGKYDKDQVIDTIDEEIFVEEREGAKVISSRVESTESDSGKEGAVVSFELMNKDVEEYAYDYDLDVASNGKGLNKDDYTVKWVDEPDRVISAVESETVKAKIMISNPEENDEYSATLSVKDENEIESVEEIKFASVPALLGLNANGSSDFNIKVNPDKDEYYPGDSIEFEITYTNNTKSDIQANIIPSLSPNHGDISGYDSAASVKIAKGGGKETFTYTVTIDDDISSNENIELSLDAYDTKNKKTIDNTKVVIPVVMPSGIIVKSGNAVTADTDVNDGILASEFTLKNNEDHEISYDYEIVVSKNGTVLSPSNYAVEDNLSGSISGNNAETGNVTVKLKKFPQPGDEYTVEFKATDENSNESSKSVVFKRKLSDVVITPDRQGPYLAGSDVTFTVTYTAPGAVANAKNIVITPDIDNADIMAANSALTADTITYNNKVNEYSSTFVVHVPEDFDEEQSIIHFTADVSWTGDRGATGKLGAEKYGFYVKALKGVMVTDGSDNDSDMGNKLLKASFELKNYDYDESPYTYELELKSNGSVVDPSDYQVSWPAPLPDADSTDDGLSMGSRDKATAKVNIQLSKSTIAAPYDITLRITDTNTGSVSEKTVHLEPAALEDIVPIGLIKNGGLDLLYYGDVAKDDRVPFSNAEELRTLLTNSSKAKAKEIWDKYKYDLYDPNCFTKEDCTTAGIKNYTYAYGSGTTYPSFNDDTLNYAKEQGSNSPFHGTEFNKPLNGDIENLKYSLEDGGINFDEYFKNLEKTAGPDEGDANSSREYDIELKAETNPKRIIPKLYIFQIQTSWQMFDLLHANATKTNYNLPGFNPAATSPVNMKVGSVSNNTQLGNLYDIKQALLRFADYIESKGDGSAMIAVTNVQHTTSHSMLGDTWEDSNGTPKGYIFSNDMDTIRAGLYNYDVFGDCEHVHYDATMLARGIDQVEEILETWKDKSGTPVGHTAKTSAIIIGGPTENSTGTDGYGIDIADLVSKVKLAGGGTVMDKLDHVYGIRTNIGVNVDGVKNKYGDQITSWLDYNPNQDLFRAENNGFYIAPSEEEIYQSLIDIYNRDDNDDSVYDNSIKVNDVVISDTVRKEFAVGEDDIEVGYVNENGSFTAIGSSDYELELTSNSDGTTAVKVTYKEVVGRKTLSVRIHGQAKEDYLGSNNVYTNVNSGAAAPKIESYKHTNMVTGSTQTYDEVRYSDKPQVNVPIKFSVNDGLTVTGNPGDRIRLEDLAYKDEGMSERITDEIDDLLDNYPQTNGNISYQWVDSKGNPVGQKASYSVVNGAHGTLELPDFVYEVKDEDEGRTITYSLKVTFEPENVQDSNLNKKPVSAKSDSGIVKINVPGDSKNVNFYLYKTDKLHENLAGAEFSLYEADDDWEKVDDSLAGSGTSDSDGLVSLTDIPAGTYLLYETKAPDGYYALEKPLRVTISDSGEITVTDSENNALQKVIVSGISDDVFEVVDQKIFMLPDAGGMGIYPFAFIGAFIAMAGLMRFRRKRM